MVYLSLY